MHNRLVDFMRPLKKGECGSVTQGILNLFNALEINNVPISTTVEGQGQYDAVQTLIIQFSLYLRGLTRKNLEHEVSLNRV